MSCEISEGYLGRKSQLVLYSGLLDPVAELPQWAKRYAQWQVREGVWGERLTGRGRKRKSKEEHLEVVRRAAGIEVPWKVLISLRGTPKFVEYGERWRGSRDLRIQDLQGQVKEKSLELVHERLEDSGKGEDGNYPVTPKELGALVNAGEALQPRRTEHGDRAPLIQINVTEERLSRIQKALAGPEVVQDVEYEIVKEGAP